MRRREVQLTPDDVSEQIRGLLSKEYTAPDYLRLFQEIFEAQYQTEKKLRINDVCPPIAKEEVDRRIKQGLPVIDHHKLNFVKKEFDELFDRISSILIKRATDGNLAVSQLLEAERAGEVSPSDLAQAAITDKEESLKQFSENVEGDEGEIAFATKAVVTPFLRVCARPLQRKIDLNHIMSDRCPICGGAPLMAKLRREDGKRILECSLCNTQWTFKRLKCPFCGNEDADTLGFFFTGEATYRVDKCDKCKGYIKTVDERKKAEGELRALLIEDVATLYLDILATREGYQKIREPKN